MAHRFTQATIPTTWSGQKGPNGRALCCWCGTEVPKGRRSWCSQKCVDEYLDLSDLNRIENRIKERDLEICQVCGLNCRALKELLGRLRSVKHGYYDPDRRGYYGVYEEVILRNLRLGTRCHRYWEIDHIVPVAEGGSNAHENLQTICLWCHRANTADQARRKAAERKKQKALDKDSRKKP